MQQYQSDAADAVSSVFEGLQNQGASAYLRDLGATKRYRDTESGFAFAQSEEGCANPSISAPLYDLLCNKS